MSEESLLPMQFVGIRLYDSAGNQIAAAQYYDAWIDLRGAKSGAAGENTFYPTYNTLPFDGTASVDILRVGDNIDVLWDGESLVSGTSSLPLSRVDLEFGYYAYDGQYGTAFFGSEAVDWVKIQGDCTNPVPAPGAIALAVVGAAFVARRRQRELSQRH